MDEARWHNSDGFRTLDRILAILRPIGLNATLSGGTDASVEIPKHMLHEGMTRPDKALREQIWSSIQGAFNKANIPIRRLSTTGYNFDAAHWRVDFKLLDIEDPYYYGENDANASGTSEG